MFCLCCLSSTFNLRSIKQTLSVSSPCFSSFSPHIVNQSKPEPVSWPSQLFTNTHPVCELVTSTQHGSIAVHTTAWESKITAGDKSYVISYITNCSCVKEKKCGFKDVQVKTLKLERTGAVLKMIWWNWSLGAGFTCFYPVWRTWKHRVRVFEDMDLLKTDKKTCESVKVKTNKQTNKKIKKVRTQPKLQTTATRLLP